MAFLSVFSGQDAQSPQSQPAPKQPVDVGQQIVVLDRGFVYVGNVTEHDEHIIIENARNIRKWGTSNGLGELRNGPLNATILDDCGTVQAPKKAVICYIKSTGF